MLHELWWAVPGKLAGMRKPASVDEVCSLRPEVTGIISLLDDTENHDFYTAAEMPFLWLPVRGGGNPSEVQVQQARRFFKDIQTKGGALAVHCSGGRKRTGTLIAAILAENMLPDAALEAVVTANPGVQLNAQQLAFVAEMNHFRKTA